MPIYEPDHIEYAIDSGHIQIVTDDGRSLPAYLAHPRVGMRFPGVTLIHDWWGVTPIVRRLANLFAQMGYYVIIPDLFYGKIAKTPKEAMDLVKGLGDDNGYQLVNGALAVLEHHHSCNAYVAAVGIGMGGSLAYEAAIVRGDLEAAVAFSGFPARYFGRFKDSNTPILSFYGENEPHIKPNEINKLKKELGATSLPHQIEIVNGLGHEFFKEEMPDDLREKSRDVLKTTLEFLDTHLVGPQKPQKRQAF